MRALFIYWKVRPDRLAGALAAARALQAELTQSAPALVAKMFQRADAVGDAATVMETYALPGGLDAALLLTIIDRSQAALAPWSIAGRHVEQFDLLAD